MKVLFVCRANVTRSQMAAALFNKSAPEGYAAVSAGTFVTDENGNSMDEHMLKETPASAYIFACMKEEGIDIRENIRRQVTPAMVADADMVIALVPKETTPDFMRNSPKTIYWEVPDVLSETLEKFKKVRDRIQPLVAEFVKTLA